MPLSGRRFVVAGSGPVAEECAVLLQALSAEVVRVRRVTRGLVSAGAEGAIDATGELARGAPPFPVVTVAAGFDDDRAWADSGAMWLTGAAAGPPQPCPSPVLAARVTAAGACVQLLAATTFGTPLELDAMALLGERAALTGHTRRGPVSVGGACEMVRAADGWIALNLARPDDVALLPAWVDGDIDDPADAIGLARAVGARSRAELVGRGAELGLALAPWPSGTTAAAVPFVIDGEERSVPRLRPRTAPPQRPRPPADRVPLVVDLSALWAGPLAGGLLAQAGALVVKVEGARRPDGARLGTAAFFDLLNAGKRCIVVDFDDERDAHVLEQLMRRACLVIEGSRRRVMDRLGIDAAAIVAGGTSWLSITAYGRDGEGANRVGFGDDVAVAAGLAIDGTPPLFVADAIADPITGLYAAVAGLACVGAATAHLVDASLHRVTRFAAGATSRTPTDHTSTDAAAPPRSRPSRGGAESVGASTREILARFAPDLTRAGRAKMPPRSLEGGS
jgi:crotonobetainyl-CoA:carnitine CoA-transferase CaiB-like acyl-CoA transferase